MPLTPPSLDNLTFEQIRQRARLRIPRYTPEWTDFNESDPGATLIELFAWLTEMMGYQMNKIPERNYLKFLQLMGLELRPAQPALVHLTFKPVPGGQTASVLQRTRVSAQPAGGGLPVIFETLEGMDLIRAEMDKVLILDGGSWTDVSVANTMPGKVSYHPLGWVPQVGNALYLGFHVDPQKPPPKPVFPQQMSFRVFLPAAAQAGQPDACLNTNASSTAPVKLVWEYRLKGDNPPRWQRLGVNDDKSAGLTREGAVLVQGPDEDFVQSIEGTVQEPRFWLRIRLENGAYPAGKAPVLDFIRPNVVSAENLTTVEQELVGVSKGSPGQSFTLLHNPVQAETLVLNVIEPGEDSVLWTQKPDFLASQAEDTHFVLNPVTGEISFGDGQNGLIPVAGAQIVATAYRYGGGTAGNVAENLANGVSIQGVDSVTNERRAVGGRDLQKISDFMRDAPGILRHRDRAISAEDYSKLASMAGGVSKAIALSLAHPDHPGVRVPGAVTVVVIPDNDDMPPIPSQDQLEVVCAYLETRRLLTTELYVRGPVFHPVKVQARVQAQSYASFDDVAQKINAALNAYLDPQGRKPEDASPNWQPGSDFGLALFPTSLYNIILDVKQVMVVSHLSITVDGVPRKIDEAVGVEPWGMLYGVPQHDILVEPFKGGQGK